MEYGDRKVSFQYSLDIELRSIADDQSASFGVEAVQAAGGLRPFANKSKIQVSRCDKDGKKSTYIIDLIEIGEKGRIEKDIVLRAGDVVWVPETWY